MTTLEMILIIYISLNWFLIIMFIFLPNSVFRKVFLLSIIVCPPLIIGFIVEGIRETHNKRKNMKLYDYLKEKEDDK